MKSKTYRELFGAKRALELNRPKEFGQAKQKGDKTPTKDRIRATNSEKPKWLKEAQSADKFVGSKLKGKAPNLLDVAESTSAAPKRLLPKKMKQAEQLYRSLKEFNWESVVKARNPKSKKLKSAWETSSGKNAHHKLVLGIGFVGTKEEQPDILDSKLSGNKAVEHNVAPKLDEKVRRVAEAKNIARNIKHPLDIKHYKGR